MNIKCSLFMIWRFVRNYEIEWKQGQWLGSHIFWWWSMMILDGLNTLGLHGSSCDDLTTKLKPLIFKKTWCIDVWFLWLFGLHVLYTSLFIELCTYIVVKCLQWASSLLIWFFVNLFDLWTKCFKIKSHGWKEKT